MTRPIPALIVSGFLGAGKTTLVGHLLKEAQRDGIKLAIISNEFGDVGIDQALLDAGQEGLVELDGGCVCCRLSDALGETLEMLLTEVKPDRLILETSGVANPGEILIQFWRPPIDALISEEVVVVCVDPESYGRHHTEPNPTFQQQIEAADVIVITKCDLAERASVDGLSALLSEVTGGQPILEATWGDVPSEVLFPPDPEGTRRARRDPGAEPTPHDHEQFKTVELRFDEPMYPAEANIKILGHGAIRAKGFIRTPDGPKMIQSVGPRVNITDPPIPVPDELMGLVVLIKRA